MLQDIARCLFTVTVCSTFVASLVVTSLLKLTQESTRTQLILCLLPCSVGVHDTPTACSSMQVPEHPLLFKVNQGGDHSADTDSWSVHWCMHMWERMVHAGGREPWSCS